MINAILALLLTNAFTFATVRLDQFLVVHGECQSARVRSWLEIEGEQLDSAATLRLTDSLFAHGYLDSEVRVTSDSIIVYSGELFDLRPAEIVGDTVILNRAPIQDLPWSRSAEFGDFGLESSASELLTWCENHGYPFARVEVDSLSVDFSSKSIRPFIKVLSGPEIRINFIEFTGNRVARQSLLKRESRVQLGTPFNAQRINQAQRRLSQLEYVASVADPRIVVGEEGESGLLIDIAENRLSRVDIVAGLSPKTDNQNQVLTGLIDLQFLNLFGTGRRGKIHWQRPSEDVQELSLAWREAWVAGLPFYIDAAFDQRVEDTLYVTRKYGVRAGMPVTSTAEVFIGTSREELLADSNTAASYGFVTNRTRFYEVGVAIDTRDHSTNPRAGFRFETSAARGTRKTNLPPGGSTKTNFEQHRATADVEVNQEVYPYWIANVSGHVRVLETDEPSVQVSDLYRVGGARTLRGYREEQFLGEQIIWTSFEARYWLGIASRFHTFTDWGAIYNESSNESGRTLTEITRGAYGIGLRLETGIGVWGIDYGVSTGNSPMNGQLHVSLLSLF